MTYVYETTMGGKTLVVEYVHSSVTDSIKVVDMTADGKFHRLNWMNDYGRNKLLAELEEDLISALDKVQGVPEVKVPLPTSKALLEESTAQ